MAFVLVSIDAWKNSILPPNSSPEPLLTKKTLQSSKIQLEDAWTVLLGLWVDSYQVLGPIALFPYTRQLNLLMKDQLDLRQPENRYIV